MTDNTPSDTIKTVSDIVAASRAGEIDEFRRLIKLASTDPLSYFGAALTILVHHPDTTDGSGLVTATQAATAALAAQDGDE